VLFEALRQKQTGENDKSSNNNPEAESQSVKKLKHELATTREYMQSIIEDQEASNEELKSANEEIQSTNEELQSTNEEMETTKEELQSTNEELATVNDELENRNTELSHANNDMTNLLSSVNIPILMLGQDLRIRQFTPQAEKLLNLIDSDLGRPISQIRSNVEVPELEQMVTEVIDTMRTYSKEVKDQSGHWYDLRIRPYKTLDNRIEGAVLTYLDIDEIKQSEKLKDYAVIVRNANDAIIGQNFNGEITAWNPAAERLYGWSEEEALAMTVSQLMPAEALSLNSSMLDSIKNNRLIKNIETSRHCKSGETIKVSLSASLLLNEMGEPQSIVTIEKVLI
jgi:two-component system CheB/CheR fusion protein